MKGDSSQNIDGERNVFYYELAFDEGSGLPVPFKGSETARDSCTGLRNAARRKAVEICCTISRVAAVQFPALVFFEFHSVLEVEGIESRLADCIKAVC